MAQVHVEAIGVGAVITVAVAALLPYPRRKDMGTNQKAFDPNVLPDNPALPNDPSQKAFILRIAPLTRKVQVLTGIPASVGIAQAIHETAWGTSGIYRDLNNLFGFKAGCDTSGKPRPRASSQEWLEVDWVAVFRPVNEPCPYFRKYSSAYDSILDWALRFYRLVFKFKADDGSIAKALANRKSWDLFLASGALWNYNSLPGDPRSQKYTSMIVNLIRTYQLYRYDVPVNAWRLRPDVAALVPAS
jgi:hypothetical protein